MISILIPSKNEPYLKQTLEDIERNKELDTEVLWREDYGIGQRALTRELALEAKGDYIMKVDAHCSFSQGFDKALMEEMEEKMILAPLLLPLDAEQWVINGRKQMGQFVFDTNMVMQHAGPEVGETMCLQGSAWLISKQDYFDWNLDDDSFGSWGGQAVELGIKAFLNGGVCKTTRSAYYGHLFRHTDSDFPYDRGDHPGQKANEELIRRYKNESIRPLVEKFGYPLGWKEYFGITDGVDLGT